jgi:transposase
MAQQPIFIGIDVGKDWLDVAQHTDEEVQRFSNNELGILELVAHLETLRPNLVVMEATGGFEFPAAAALAAATIPVVIANPRQTRDFAKSTELTP